MYVILRPFSLADQGVIWCGIWKSRLDKYKFEKIMQLVNHIYHSLSREKLNK